MNPIFVFTFFYLVLFMCLERKCVIKKDMLLYIFDKVSIVVRLIVIEGIMVRIIFWSV